MKSFKKVNIKDADDYICQCGNDSSDSGFFPCDKKGNEVEPIPGWEGHYRCAKCEDIHVLDLTDEE